MTTLQSVPELFDFSAQRHQEVQGNYGRKFEAFLLRFFYLFVLFTQKARKTSYFDEKLLQHVFNNSLSVNSTNSRDKALVITTLCKILLLLGETWLKFWYSLQTLTPFPSLFWSIDGNSYTGIQNWHFLHICNQIEVKWREVAQSCLTLCNPMDCSPPGSSIHGIFQARVLEWVAISFSR